jgi:hypothetical protein
VSLSSNRRKHPLTYEFRYNATVRGNGAEDGLLQELAHTCYALYEPEATVKSSPRLTRFAVPTRLLYFDYSRRECRLVETKGRVFDYMACGGLGTSDLVPHLKADTIQGLKQGFRYPTIRLLNVASTLMEQAGFRYLWVDTLCIMQDNVDEWAYEARRLADVYANSRATISVQLNLTGSSFITSPWVTVRTDRSNALRLGEYVLHSHGTKKFNQAWFSRIAAAWINLASFASWETVPVAGRNISYPYQDYDATVMPLRGLRKKFFLDFPEDALEVLRELLVYNVSESQETQYADWSSTHTLDTETDRETRETLTKYESKIVTAETTTDQEEHRPEGEAVHVELFLQDGVVAWKRGDTVQATGHFLHARDVAITHARTSPHAMRIHGLGSIYLSFIYSREGLIEVCSDLLERSRSLLPTGELLDPVRHLT